MNLYLIAFGHDAAIIASHDLDGIDLPKLGARSVRLIGYAHPDVQPGPVLCGPGSGVTRCGPLGREVWTPEAVNGEPSHV